MYKPKNHGKFIDTERKYSPTFIGDLIFPNAQVKSVITAYASGEVTRPLILCGRNGTGKSLIAKLLPKAIEGIDKVITTYIKPYELNSDKEVDKLISRNKMFDTHFSTNGQRYSYYIIEEMNFRIGGHNSFRTAIDNYVGIDLTIITTNEIAQIDKGIRSRHNGRNSCCALACPQSPRICRTRSARPASGAAGRSHKRPWCSGRGECRCGSWCDPPRAY